MAHRGRAGRSARGRFNHAWFNRRFHRCSTATIARWRSPGAPAGDGARPGRAFRPQPRRSSRSSASSYFPRTDPGQFVINIKAPTGTRLELTSKIVKQVEDIVRQDVEPHDLGMIVANIGITPDFSAMYTSNSGPHTAFVQVSLRG